MWYDNDDDDVDELLLLLLVLEPSLGAVCQHNS
jgi:hypothetical protein